MIIFLIRWWTNEKVSAFFHYDDDIMNFSFLKNLSKTLWLWSFILLIFLNWSIIYFNNFSPNNLWYFIYFHDDLEDDIIATLTIPFIIANLT